MCIRDRVSGTVEAVAISTKAKQALIIEFDTGRVLLAKNAETPMHPASMTKMMTAYMLFDHLKSGILSLETRFRVSRNAWRKGGSKMFVKVNEDVRIEDLIRGIIVQSGNDACIVIAEALNGSEEGFSEQMNKKAIELGVDGVEIDVFRCLSGEIVVFHDKTLDKLTNGSGYIEDKSLSELKELKVLGSKYSIPTLEEVIKSIGKGVILNIELKGSNTSEGSLEMANKYIKQGEINLSEILFSSFNWKELSALRKLDKNVKIALITEDDPLNAIPTASVSYTHLTLPTNREV